MYKVCVDIGGTFTDCVVSDEQGNLRQFKAPSTPKNFEQGVMDALGEAAIGYAMTPEQFNQPDRAPGPRLYGSDQRGRDEKPGTNGHDYLEGIQGYH